MVAAVDGDAGVVVEVAVVVDSEVEVELAFPERSMPTPTPGNPMEEYSSGAALCSRCMPSCICIMA